MLLLLLWCLLLCHACAEALAKALLPAYSEAGVTPQERAFVSAASVARLSAVLLALLELPPTQVADVAAGPPDACTQLHPAHAPWLSKPWPLDAVSTAALGDASADAAPWDDASIRHRQQLVERFPGLMGVPRTRNPFRLKHCPTAMLNAAEEAELLFVKNFYLWDRI